MEEDFCGVMDGRLDGEGSKGIWGKGLSIMEEVCWG
jgi:hypothetical protein